MKWNQLNGPRRSRAIKRFVREMVRHCEECRDAIDRPEKMSYSEYSRKVYCGKCRVKNHQNFVKKSTVVPHSFARVGFTKTDDKSVI